MTSAVRPAGIEIVVPAHWWELPLDPGTRDVGIAELVDGRARRQFRLRPYRDSLVALLRDLAAKAAALGAVYCAQAGAPPGAEPGVVPANVLVMFCRLGANDGGTVLDRVAGLLAHGDPAGSGAAEIGLASLPLAGQAVRVRRHRTAAGDAPGALGGGLLIQYYVPVLATDDFALITFTSPAMAHAAMLAALFDTIAATFAFTDARRRVTPVTSPLPRQ
jgi:hypothetical protein